MPLMLVQPESAIHPQAEVSLRTKARPEDREGIRRVLSSSGFFQEREILVAGELLDDCLARGVKSDYFFIFADRGAELAGFCCFGPIAMAPGRCDLYWIAVLPDNRFSGIGSRLLQAAEAGMRSLDGQIAYIETSSRPLYAPTHRFYLKHQYREVARIPRYYADNDDRLVYMKTL